MLLKGSNTNPVRIIPNAWGMKSVKLDGPEIGYAKDWMGEWKRVNNDRDHTLVFEWYPLSDDMKTLATPMMPNTCSIVRTALTSRLRFLSIRAKTPLN